MIVDGSLLVAGAVMVAYLLDLLLGDPVALPHPIVYFGKAISFSDKHFNKGRFRLLKGAAVASVLVALVYILFSVLMFVSAQMGLLFNAAVVCLFFFFGLANKTLITEGLAVFRVLENEGLESGRRQLSRIVGRDTSQLSEQQIKKATLETMAENLSDGVVAPVFWFAILGIPGMMAYKMINTLDSMIGYKNNRYLYFGRVAAYIDDVANYLPARLTAVLMVVVSFSFRALLFIFKYGKKHSSPNAGYPEAALAGILNVQFGGPNIYHGKLVEKPFIGECNRGLIFSDIKRTVYVNHSVSAISIVLCVIVRYIIQ